MAMLKCGVCETEFPAIRERHYVVRDRAKTGIVATFSSNDEPEIYDSFDCPNCGCQVIAKSRKYSYIPVDTESGDGEEQRTEALNEDH